MKVILLAPTIYGRERLDPGDELEVTEHSGAKMIARGWARAEKAKPKAKPKAALRAVAKDVTGE